MIFRRMLRLGALSLLIFGLSCSGNARNKPSALRLHTPEAVEFIPPKPEQWTLPNGLTVMYQRDDEIPMVRGSLFIKGGGWWESDEEFGTVEAMGSLMRLGGAGALGGDELDRALERLAASIGSGFGGEVGEIGFRCYNGDIAKVFGYFADVIMRPRFEQKHLDLWKAQVNDSIRRRIDDPEEVASLSIYQVLYGNTPYGRVVKYADVDRIQRGAILRAHDYFVRPNEAILVVTGDIGRSDVENLVVSHLGNWKRRESELPQAPALDYEAEAKIIFIELPYTQANIYMGHLGVPRLTPDFAAISGFNHIFGESGFGSRLVRRVRTELGFAYDTYGAISPGRVKGVNYMVVQTKAENTGDAILEATRVLHLMQTDYVTDTEIMDFKSARLTSFVFAFDSAEKINARAAKQKLLDYPADYDSRFIAEIKALSKEDIRKVAKNRWDLNKLVIVVVGPKNSYTSLVNSLQNAPDYLKNLRLVRASFDQKLVLADDDRASRG